MWFLRKGKISNRVQKNSNWQSQVMLYKSCKFLVFVLLVALNNKLNQTFCLEKSRATLLCLFIIIKDHCFLQIKSFMSCFGLSSFLFFTVNYQMVLSVLNVISLFSRIILNFLVTLLHNTILEYILYFTSISVSFLEKGLLCFSKHLFIPSIPLDASD